MYPVNGCGEKKIVWKTRCILLSLTSKTNAKASQIKIFEIIESGGADTTFDHRGC